MKAHAIGGRDKPKDVYDICYCLDAHPDAITVVAVDGTSLFIRTEKALYRIGGSR